MIRRTFDGFILVKRGSVADKLLRIALKTGLGRDVFVTAARVGGDITTWVRVGHKPRPTRIVR